ncbi:MAG: hypothetical protein JW955_24770 [Sedimentisphaerales bacterium]|nr:hypothetical protein [Sedimentisphaerales bacterium]
MSNLPPRRPEKEFRCGPVVGAIWRHESTKNGRTFSTFSIRIYKSQYDADTRSWSETNFFFAEDLPRLGLVSQKCYEYVALRERDPNAPADIETVEQVS